MIERFQLNQQSQRSLDGVECDFWCAHVDEGCMRNAVFAIFILARLRRLKLMEKSWRVVACSVEYMNSTIHVRQKWENNIP